MKRLLTVLVIILLLFTGFIYWFIPATLNVQSTAAYHANREAVYRYLSQPGKWKEWWPGSITSNSPTADSFVLGNYRFGINKIGYQLIGMDMASSNEKFATELKAIPLTKDSLGLVLSISLPVGSTPWSRISGYFKASNLKTVLDTILNSAVTHTSLLQNLYGISIKNEKVQYADVLSTKLELNHYPETGEIYALIDKLRAYAQKAGAKALFSPMVNVSGDEISKIRLQVGLPIDRKVPEKDDISVKWMMKDGNILVAEIVGPQSGVDAAQKQMEQYIIDNHRTIIAIPFQMHITDRRQNTDSSRWVTQIYYPVV